ncbi:hypothetical protein JTE90_021586 [Oedothorax gibbosus]|uniref:Uncharacterized protein n=1 Tax=Oedothorax gibbosus TaxID=931172 RepID=A0AAV6VQH6_9ARAC|nr:hypothetical protein JTE90_021586 [Oedothorax gibbosus]
MRAHAHHSIFRKHPETCVSGTLQSGSTLSGSALSRSALPASQDGRSTLALVAQTVDRDGPSLDGLS